MADSPNLQDLVHEALNATSIPRRWAVADRIARRGRRALHLASTLLRSESEDEQVIGAEILGRLDPVDSSLCETAVGLLTSAIVDGSAIVAAEAALSIARLPTVSLVERLVMLRLDTRAGVRLACGIGLFHYGAEAEAALVELARDPNPEVRSWATFALVTSNVDSEPVRKVLRERASESRADIRGEALIGLARIGDPSARDLISSELMREPVGSWVAEAALLAPRAEFVGGLSAWLAAMDSSSREELGVLFEQAIAACSAMSGPDSESVDSSE